MEENKDINKLYPLAKKTFMMEPPADAWNSLDADLEKRQAIIYKQRGNRFKLLSIGLALLLISFIAYHYLSPQNHDMAANVTRINEPLDSESTSGPVANTQSEISNKSVAGKTSEMAALSELKNILPDLKNEKAIIHERTNALKKTAREVTENANDVKAAGKQNEKALNSGETTAAARDERNISPTITDAVANSAPEEGQTVDTEKNPPPPKTESSGKQAAASEKPAMKDAPPAAAVHDSTLVKQSNRPSHFSLAIFYSPEYSGNYLKNNRPDHPEVMAKYKEREKPKYSFNIGLLVRYDLSKKWSIVSGASYSTIAYSITLNTVYARANSSDEVHYMYPTSCGVIEMPNAGNTVLHVGDSLTGMGGCEQTVRFIDVPLLARFQVEHNRFTFYSSAGVSASFVLEEVATMRSGNYETKVVNNITGLQKMNYRFLFGLGSEYRLNNNTSFFIEPALRASITSLTQNTFVDCYPYSFGINIGFSYHF